MTAHVLRAGRNRPGMRYLNFDTVSAATFRVRALFAEAVPVIGPGGPVSGQYATAGFEKLRTRVIVAPPLPTTV